MQNLNYKICHLTVSELTYEQGNQSWSLLDKLFDNDIKEKINVIHPPISNEVLDTCIQGGIKNGEFTIAYALKCFTYMS